MGCNRGEQKDEKPEHMVELSSFYIGKYPVTNEQFVRFLNAYNVSPEEYLYKERYTCVGEPDREYWKHDVIYSEGTWQVVKGTEDHAASCSVWNLANKYCEWMSKSTGRKCRLPTEAEWEYVCRGKEGRKFPWGNRIEGSTVDEQLKDMKRKMWNWRTRTLEKPGKIPVGSFPEGATPEGVMDMIGYMVEWCSDWYDPEYYSKSPIKDPKGPFKPVRDYENYKVCRGGDTAQRSGFFYQSRFFGILPADYTPRGWTRGLHFVGKGGSFVPRLGFRVVIEISED